MALLQISEPGHSPLPHQYKRAVGIDLGTTNSLVATVGSDAKAVVIGDENGEVLLPSVVRFQKDGSGHTMVETGCAAQQFLAIDANNTLASFKRWMGRSLADVEPSPSYQFSSDASSQSVVKVKTDVGLITAVEASSEILKTLKSRANDFMGADIEGAVITVPAYFDDAQRQATKEAALIAGIPVLRLINEPTAAAVAYGLDKADDRYVAVYDLGGGTFDVSILQLSKGFFEVLSTGGNSSLGGDDFDHAIAEWVLAELELTSEALSQAEYRQLLIDSKNAKQQLSNQTLVGISLRRGDGAMNAIELSRETFNDLIDQLITQTIVACNDCVKEAGLNVADIDDVVMVGGSTRIPAVRDRVAQVFNTEPKTDVDPDQVVAVGAAIQADALIGNKREQSLLLLDVIPLSLGLETMGGLVEKIVPRNTAIPCTRAQEFTTYKDGQTALSIHVLQGEREKVDDCRSLARFELRDIPAMVAGAARIKVEFAIDADGMLQVSAEETETGTTAAIDVKPSFGLSEDEIANMIRASFEYANVDKDARMLAEQKVDGQALLDAIAAALDSDGDLLDDDERQILRAALSQLEGHLVLDDTAVLRESIDWLGKLSEPFAERRMNRSIQQALQGKNLQDFEG